MSETFAAVDEIRMSFIKYYLNGFVNIQVGNKILLKISHATLSVSECDLICSH
jgi:hypothetical protein